MPPNPAHQVGERWLIFFFTITFLCALSGGMALVNRWPTPPALIIDPPPTAQATFPTPSPSIQADATPAAQIPVSITVMVSGEVQQPGLIALPVNATIADAIAATGGFTDQADPSALDLAELLLDGAAFSVPQLAEANQNSDASLIDLNTASAAELETLPGIGPQTAQAIITHRPYRRVSELNRVPGFGEATINKLRGLITVNK